MSRWRTTTQRWRSYFVPLVFQKTQLQDYSAVPRFAFAEEDPATVALRVAISLVGLLVPGAVIAAFAFHRLRRYPVVG